MDSKLVSFARYTVVSLMIDNVLTYFATSYTI